MRGVAIPVPESWTNNGDAFPSDVRASQRFELPPDA